MNARGVLVASVLLSPGSTWLMSWRPRPGVITKNNPSPGRPRDLAGRLTTPVWNWAAGSLPPDLILPPEKAIER
jgi:hypothetical protein